MPHGGRRTLKLTAQLRGSATFTELSLTLVARLEAPVALLAAPGGEVGPELELLLDGSDSRDPEDPSGAGGPLSFSWACWQQDNLAPCFTTVGEVGSCGWRVLVGAACVHTLKGACHRRSCLPAVGASCG